ncbi:uncharacterized protein PgNI_00427 [Pyricularia grisea]|uniref:Uncharacterized protein n=1 Tax=Pyricularia grisea TaxID=148305 RepID=A0A6P8BIQ8_PYRGI|nr:uncharacterized protein PgNI_00427 [Pyricularia grisea]TLD16600.1 hypothetical protein PgNI_00427 [Pyricularia grisea]
MEVVYVQPQDYSAYHSGDIIHTTQSTEDEANRIMDWNYGLAKTDAPRNVYSGGGTRTTLTHRPRYVDLDDDPILLRRSVTTSTIIEGSPYSSSSGSPSSVPKADSSISASSAGMYGLLGAAVGAAAGAAMTYGMMTKDRSQAPRQEFGSDSGPIPSVQRRSTFPEQKVNFTTAPQYPHPPPPMPGQRYVELERTVEKIRYPEDFATNGHYPHPPAYMARYSQVGGPSSKKGDVFDDSKSRYSSSSKYRGDRLIREAPAVGQVPLLLTEAEHRSHVGSSISRHSTVKPPPSEQRSYVGSKYAPSTKPPPAAPNPPPPMSTTRRSAYESATDRDTYVSARSHRSTSTLRADPVSRPEPGVYGSYPPPAGSSRGSRVASRVKSSSTIRGRDRDINETPKDRSHSRASTKFERQFPMPNNPVARHYPLPPSHDGRSLYSEMPAPQKSHRSSSGRKSHHRESQPLTRSALDDNDRATWEEWDEDDDDAVSLAPSDSISCVGSKKSSRSRR